MSWWKRLFTPPASPESFELPEGFREDSIMPSPDARKLAYVVPGRDGWRVEVNGHSDARWQGAGGLYFAPDSSDVAYAAMYRNEWYAVYRRKIHGPYLDIGTTSPTVSPDGASVAYTARLPAGWYGFRDGVACCGPYEGFCGGGLLFSPDSRRLAGAVQLGHEWAAMMDGKELGRHASILERSWTFSPDSRRFAYLAGSGQLNERTGMPSHATVVVDGVEEVTCEHDPSRRLGLAPEVHFSPDSRRVAYGLHTVEGFRFVVDGIPGATYGALVSGVGADPDRLRLPGAKRVTFRYGAFSFSPDSRHFAYAVADLKRNRHVVVLDGEEMATHDSVVNSPVVFSPDSQRIAYGAADGSDQFLVLDWTPLRSFYGLCLGAGGASFSADSQHVAYLTMPARNRYAFAIDAESWALEDGPVIGTNLVWDGETAHTLACRDRCVSVRRFPEPGGA